MPARRQTRKLEYTVVYAPKYPTRIIKQAQCSHDPAHVITVNTRIEKCRRQRSIMIDGTMCLGCGLVKPVSARWTDWWHGWFAAWREFGWNRIIGLRLMKLADAAGGVRAALERSGRAA